MDEDAIEARFTYLESWILLSNRKYTPGKIASFMSSHFFFSILNFFFKNQLSLVVANEKQQSNNLKINTKKQNKSLSLHCSPILLNIRETTHNFWFTEHYGTCCWSFSWKALLSICTSGPQLSTSLRSSSVWGSGRSRELMEPDGEQWPS